MTPARVRRCIVIPLILIAGSSGLWSCATPGLQCGMKDDYREQRTLAATGKVSVSWNYNKLTAVGKYGDHVCDESGKNCHIVLAGKPPAFNDVCGLAKFGHEMAHLMEVHEE